jgi:hypothetical protein
MNDGQAFELPPEAAALLRRQFEIDYEAAGPKAPYGRMVHKGVRIESRWDVVSEFETMRKIIDAMPELMARRLAWIWCDSNCGSNFVVGAKPSRFVPALKWEVADAVKAANGGHNGIIIEDGERPFTGRTLASIDCDWGEVDLG